MVETDGLLEARSSTARMTVEAPACWTTRAGLFQPNRPMSATTHSTEKPADAEPTDDHDELITGPHMEPAAVANATTYWRCEDCGRESIRRGDLERPAFHVEGCRGAGD